MPGLVLNPKHITALVSSMYGSRYSKTGLVVLLIGTVFHIIGFSVPYWELIETRSDTTRRGLWKECGDSFFGRCVSLRQESGWLQTVRVLESLSLVLEVAAIVAAGVYMLMALRKCIGTSAGLSLLSGGLSITGVALYAAKHDSAADLDWGCAFEAIGGLNCLAAGGVFIYEAKTHTSYARIN